MNEATLINHLADNAVDIEMAVNRLAALELAVSWLMYRQPDDSGLAYLAAQANDLEELGTDPGVVAELDLLIASVASFREQLGPFQGARPTKPAS